MKRVGNKSGQLVRSASRRGKSASRFQFDVTVDRIYGVKPGFNYVVKWSRGVKVATTKPILATKEHTGKNGLPVDEKISLLVTLYREDGKRFDQKEAKLSIIAVNPTKKQEKTVAKTRFDLSTFAGVPTASTSKTFKLAEKYSIRTVVDSRFVKAGASGPGSAGASSALSGMTGVSGRSSDDDDDPDEFDDLAIDDIPEPEVVAPSSAKSKRAAANSKLPVTNSNVKVPLVAESPVTMAPPSSAGSSSKDSAIAYERTAPKKTSPSFATGRREKSKTNEIADATSEKLVATEAKLTKLIQDNEQLQRNLESQREERRQAEQSYTRNIEDLKSKLDSKAREQSRIESKLGSNAATERELLTKNSALKDTVSRLQAEIDRTKKSKDELELKCKRLDAAEEKNRELSREIDRLTVVTAKSSDQSSSASMMKLEERMSTLREEKETLERKVKSHEAHGSKVKSAYEQLSSMYNGLRDQNVKLQGEVQAEKEKVENAQIAVRNDDNELSIKLQETTNRLSEVEKNNRSLKGDNEQMHKQVTSFQDRINKMTITLEDSKRLCDEYKNESQNLKRKLNETSTSLASREATTSINGNQSAKIEKYEEELRNTKEKSRKDQQELQNRLGELESEIDALREDVEYEKSEKMKAREERDTFRETARALERRTSQAAKKSDDVNSLRRQLSMHQMREQDQEAIIADLQRKVKHLQKEVEQSRADFDGPPSGDDISEVLQDLVATKLALAQSEDEKLQIQFDMKIMRKNEKGIQQKLAAHASRLEVKLGQANEELEKMKKEKRLESATEFNDLGSDVDY